MNKVLVIATLTLLLCLSTLPVYAESTKPAVKSIASFVKENTTLKARIKVLEKKLAEMENQKPCLSPSVTDDKTNSVSNTTAPTKSVDNTALLAYLQQRNDIMNKINAIMKTTQDKNVSSYDGALTEAATNMSNLGSSINNLSIPNVSISNYLINDKNLIRTLQTSYKPYIFSLKNYQYALDSGYQSLIKTAYDDLKTNGDKVTDLLQQIQDNYTYIQFELQKAAQ